MKELYKDRQYWIKGLFVLASLILLMKACHLQTIDNSSARRAKAISTSKYTLYPSRGLIYDRKGRLLVNNNPVYDVMVTFNQVDKEMDKAKFCNLLGISESEFDKRLNKRWGGRYQKYSPFIFLSTISAERYARFQESLYEFPGFFVQTRNVRGYPHKNAAHVLGYIREVTQKEIDKNPKQYALGDYIGGSGLELEYENQLRGKKGARHVLRDKIGREVASLDDGQHDTLAQSGKDLIASIDIALQAYGEQLMQNKTGSIVAIEPKTGEILAMISAPNYNPNLMTINRNRGNAYQALSRDSLNPLFNRATMAQYPPGSIFKNVVGLIGMETEVSPANRGIYCPGFYAYNGRNYRCRNHPSPQNIGIALQFSCNTYFWTVFRNIVDMKSFYEPEVGLDTFYHYTTNFGIGQKLGIDFPQEESGNVPNSDYYNKIYPKDLGSWKSPTIMSLGIGQGEILMTGIQMANLAATISNRGYYYTPHLVRRFLEDDTPIDAQYTRRHDVGIEAAHFEYAVDGMVSVVANGTARRAQVEGISVGGKTGTVQNPHGEDHSTFIAFAPAENPQIAISVYVENAGGGSRYAAPIAGLMIEKYLKGEISEKKKYAEQQILEADLNAKAQ